MNRSGGSKAIGAGAPLIVGGQFQWLDLQFVSEQLWVAAAAWAIACGDSIGPGLEYYLIVVVREIRA